MLKDDLAEDNTTSSDDENTEHKDDWPMHVKCEIKGDIILGALMMVHERDEKEKGRRRQQPTGGSLYR